MCLGGSYFETFHFQNSPLIVKCFGAGFVSPKGLLLVGLIRGARRLLLVRASQGVPFADTFLRQSESSTFLAG
jgi:hypothetical protein